MPAKENQVVEIEDVTCTKETEKAILVEVQNEEFWIPKSLIADTSEVNCKGDEGTLVIPEWFAEKEGITY